MTEQSTSPSAPDGPAVSEYDDALTLDPLGPGRWAAGLLDGWAIGGAVNGGFLMALAGKAAGLEGGLARGLAAGLAGGLAGGVHPDVLAMSTHFFAACAEGPAEVTAEVLRSGRSQSTAQVSVFQAGSERLRSLVTLGALGALDTTVHRQADAPVVPPPEKCVPASASPAFAEVAKIIGRLDLRIDPSTAGFALGQPSGKGEIRGWIRFGDGRDADPGSLLFFLDALPPVAFDLGALGWVPTITLSAHIRAVPAPGWLLVSLTTENFSGGFLEEDATIWDSTGRMVAQSRQLAGVRLPRERPAGS